MGYESRLYVVSHYDNYGEIIGMVNLYKIGGRPDVFKNPIDYYIFPNDEDFPTKYDKYGDVLTDCSLDEAIDCIKEMDTNELEKNGKPYRRFSMALGMFQAIRDSDQWAHKNIRVIHYGY